MNVRGKDRRKGGRVAIYFSTVMPPGGVINPMYVIARCGLLNCGRLLKCWQVREITRDFTGHDTRADQVRQRLYDAFPLSFQWSQQLTPVQVRFSHEPYSHRNRT